MQADCLRILSLFMPTAPVHLSLIHIYTKTALEGLTQNVEDYNDNLKKYLSVDCYQPMYGYCGCFMRDVTQRRDMERQLYEEKERYRVAMESSIDLLFEYDIRLQVMHSWLSLIHI